MRHPAPKSDSLTYNGPWPVQIVIGAVSIYTLYYNEDKHLELEKDYLAIDSEGHFLWCARKSDLEYLSTVVTNKLNRCGYTNHKTDKIDILGALEALEYNEEQALLWNELIVLLNVLGDCLELLPASPERKKRIRMLGYFSAHMFEGQDISNFLSCYKTTKARIVRDILFSCYEVYCNSRLISRK